MGWFANNFHEYPVTSENYWRITSRVTTNTVINSSPYIILFLTWFSGAETQINRWNPHRSITTPLLWYCDVTQTPIVTSFGSIVMRTFPSGSCASSHRRQADYHSLIIEIYSWRFHWLACKKSKLSILWKLSVDISGNVFPNADIFRKLSDIQGYKIIHQGWRCTRHGGLISYLNKAYSYELRNLPVKSNTWEGLFINVTGENLCRRLTISDTYCPPHNNNNETITKFIDELTPIVEDLQKQNNYASIVGNFNIMWDFLRIPGFNVHE